MTELTAEEQAAADRLLADLREGGYVDTQSHGELAPGVRVRHRGHQWSEAYANGTGNVVAIVHKLNSAWSREWGAADVEMVVVWDVPRPFEDSSRLTTLAQYHVEVIGSPS